MATDVITDCQQIVCKFSGGKQQSELSLKQILTFVYLLAPPSIVAKAARKPTAAVLFFVVTVDWSRADPQLVSLGLYYGFVASQQR